MGANVGMIDSGNEIVTSLKVNECVPESGSTCVKVLQRSVLSVCVWGGGHGMSPFLDTTC